MLVDSPDLNPPERFWDALECRLNPSSPYPKSVPDFTNAHVVEWTNPYSHDPTSSGKTSQMSGG